MEWQNAKNLCPNHTGRMHYSNDTHFHQNHYQMNNLRNSSSGIMTPENLQNHSASLNMGQQMKLTSSIPVYNSNLSKLTSSGYMTTDSSVTFSSVEKKLKALEFRLKAYQDASQLDQVINEKMELIRTLQDENQSLKQHVDVLSNENSELKEEIYQFSMENNELRAQISELNSKVQCILNENLSLEKEKLDRMEELERLEKKVKDYELLHLQHLEQENELKNLKQLVPNFQMSNLSIQDEILNAYEKSDSSEPSTNLHPSPLIGVSEIESLRIDNSISSPTINSNENSNSINESVNKKQEKVYDQSPRMIEVKSIVESNKDAQLAETTHNDVMDEVIDCIIEKHFSASSTSSKISQKSIPQHARNYSRKENAPKRSTSPIAGDRSPRKQSSSPNGRIRSSMRSPRRIASTNDFESQRSPRQISSSPSKKVITSTTLMKSPVGLTSRTSPRTSPSRTSTLRKPTSLHLPTTSPNSKRNSSQLTSSDKLNSVDSQSIRNHVISSLKKIGSKESSPMQFKKIPNEHDDQSKTIDASQTTITPSKDSSFHASAHQISPRSIPREMIEDDEDDASPMEFFPNHHKNFTKDPSQDILPGDKKKNFQPPPLLTEFPEDDVAAITEINKSKSAQSPTERMSPLSSSTMKYDAMERQLLELRNEIVSKWGKFGQEPIQDK